MEKTLFDAIKVGEIYFAEEVLADSINDDGTRRYDNNNNLLLDVDVKNKDGDTPLILAAKNNQVKIVDMLLRFGAYVDAVNDNGYIAFNATKNNDIIDLLIEYGTVHNYVNSNVDSGGNKKSKKTRNKYKTKR